MLKMPEVKIISREPKKVFSNETYSMVFQNFGFGALKIAFLSKISFLYKFCLLNLKVITCQRKIKALICETGGDE